MRFEAVFLYIHLKNQMTKIIDTLSGHSGKRLKNVI